MCLLHLCLQFNRKSSNIFPLFFGTLHIWQRIQHQLPPLSSGSCSYVLLQRLSEKPSESDFQIVSDNKLLRETWNFALCKLFNLTICLDLHHTDRCKHDFYVGFILNHNNIQLQQYNTVECFHVFHFLSATTVYYTTELTAAVNNHGLSICPFPDAHPSSVGTTVWSRL